MIGFCIRSRCLLRGGISGPFGGIPVFDVDFLERLADKTDSIGAPTGSALRSRCIRRYGQNVVAQVVTEVVAFLAAVIINSLSAIRIRDHVTAPTPRADQSAFKRARRTRGRRSRRRAASIDSLI